MIASRAFALLATNDPNDGDKKRFIKKKIAKKIKLRKIDIIKFLYTNEFYLLISDISKGNNDYSFWHPRLQNGVSGTGEGGHDFRFSFWRSLITNPQC